MIPRLLQQDPAFRSSARRLRLAIGVATAVLGLLTVLAIQGEVGTVGTLSWAYVIAATVCWLTLMASMLMPESRERAVPFTMALPVPQHQLWIHHAIAVFLDSLGVIAGTAGVIWLIGSILTRTVDAFPGWFAPGGAVLITRLVAVLVPAIVLLQVPQSADRRIAMDGAYWRRALAIGGAGWILLLLLSWLNPAVVLVPLGLGVLLAARHVRSLSGSYVLGEADASVPRQGPAVDGGDWPSKGRSWPVLLTAYAYSLKQPRYAFLAFGFLVIFGGAIYGGIYELWDGDDLRIGFLFLGVYLVLVYVFGSLSRLYLLDALPISRRRLLAVVIAPTFLSLWLGHGTAVLIVRAVSPGPATVKLAERESGAYVCGPLRFGGVSRTDEIPRVVAPWGESHAAWSQPIWPNSPFVVYTEQCIAEAASIDFVAWHTSRIVEDVHGRHIPPEEIQQLYLDVDEEGRVVVRDTASTIADDHGLYAHGPAAMFPFVYGSIALMSIGFLSLFLLTYRRSVGERARRAVWVGILVLVMLLHLAGFALEMGRWLEMTTAIALWDVLLFRTTQALPGGVATLWFITFLVVGIAYSLLQRQFERVELPRARGCAIA